MIEAIRRQHNDIHYIMIAETMANKQGGIANVHPDF